MRKTHIPEPNPLRHLARIVFFSFLLTFTVSRVLVILIMTHRIPDLFLHAGQTHVHHLNYGIFLLSVIGAVLLFVDLSDGAKQWYAGAYGLAMGLTFDEFGMWLHLGGGYWQRGSYDAVIVILSILGLFAFAPKWKRVGPKHYTMAGLSLLAVAVFTWLTIEVINHADKKYGDKLQSIEQAGPQ